ncbi:hypothetical protein PLICRDRAFT_104797 [Plicaturopsis crispa FD-325 SS-3]|nr:hypothetical protein PLICRDRAFT_104797 [Plicaturopsis crispa FD-325 SS-3]
MASKDQPAATPAVDVADDDAPGPPISVPDTGDTGEGGKIKMIVQLVKKCLGVKDIAAMRLSLPASLLEPIPNLEYWHYLDRPDLFAAINDSEDPLERMLAVLRFTFTKDLKFVHGKVCKPYNSVLGETFRSHWDVVPVAYPDEPSQPPIPLIYTSDPAPASAAVSTSAVDVSNLGPSDAASVKSGKSSKSTRSGLSLMSKAPKSPSTAGTSPRVIGETDIDAQMSNLSLANADGERLRVVFMTEQISHHPPVSAYYAACPSRSIEMTGIDQISAKVSGTTLRVLPGAFNKGIFVRLTGGPGEGEVYNITHPVASVNGILRGSFYVTIGDSTIIECSGGKAGEKLRTIIEYKEESWLGKAMFRVEGVIHTIDEGETQYKEWTKVKHVPDSRVVATFDGSWKHVVKWRGKSTDDDETKTLIDLSTLRVIPKSVRPLDKQHPHESRKLWDSVTTKLLAKEFGEATKSKLVIEQRQRDEAAERKKTGVEFVPQYFEKDIESGIPALTAEGRAAVEAELAAKVDPPSS